MREFLQAQDSPARWRQGVRTFAVPIGFAIALFFLPLIVRAVFQIPWVMFQNFTDGIFYWGYAMQFDDLVRRVGLNYYSVRFGGILPDALAFSLIGPHDGMPVVRYAFAGTSCSMLFLLFWKREAGIVAGLAAAFLWALNPAAIRLQQTGYVDVAGTYFLLLGTALLLFPRISLPVALAGGALLGMAVWSHTHAALALFFLIPLIVFIRAEEGSARLLQTGIAAIAGGFLITLSGSLWFGFNYGLWDITSPTREYFRILTDGGQSVNWRSSWGEVLVQSRFWFVPIPLIIAAVALRPGTKMLYGGLIAITGYIAFLAYGDVFKDGFSLSMFYYFSFGLPALVLTQSAVVTCLCREKEVSTRGAWRSAIPIAVAIIAPAAASALLPLEQFWLFAAPILAVVCLVASVFAFGKSIRSHIAILGVLASTLLVAGSSSSWMAMGNYWKSDDRALLKLAEKWVALIPKNATDPTALRFWYPDNPNDQDAKMLQSLFLHDFTRLRNEAGEIVPFGPLSSDAVRLIQKEDIRHIILLGKDPDVVEQGLRWIQETGLPIRSVRKETLKARGESMEVVQVIFEAPELVESRAEKFGEVFAHKNARAQVLSEGLEVITAPTKWSFDAWIEIPTVEEGEAVRVRFEVMKGQILLGLATDRNAESVLVERKFSSTPGEAETIFSSDFSKGARYLFVRNFLPNGARSEVILRSMDVGAVSSSDDSKE